MALTEVRDLRVRFVTREATVHAVNGVSFVVQPGEVLCILGESGSGKSVTLRALMRLLPPRSMRIEAEVSINGQDVLAKRPQALRDLRGGLAAMIFQVPMTALDPVYTPADRRSGAPPYRLWLSRPARALELSELVRFLSPERRLDAYPHELSGGLRQRAMIANGAVVQSPFAAGRRAHHCARCDSAGAGPDSAAPAAARTGHGNDLRYARSRRRLRDRRYDRGHVCRPHRRERAGCPDPERTGTSLHHRPPSLDRAWSAARSRYRRDPWQPARPPPPGAGL